MKSLCELQKFKVLVAASLELCFDIREFADRRHPFQFI